MWTLGRNKKARKDAGQTVRDLFPTNRLVTIALVTQGWK